MAGDGAAEPRVSRRCLACGAHGVANRCGGCRAVHFCGRECQKRAWPAHRPECLRIRAQADAEPEAVDSDVRIPSAADANSASVGEQEGDWDAASEEKRPLGELEAEPQPTATSTASKKKSKGKHKRKKARSKSLHLPSAPESRAANGSSPSGSSSGGGGSLRAGNSSKKPRSVSLGGKKRVLWGHVSAREFERFPGGGGAVPYDGTWALGLGAKVADVQLGSVLEREQLKAEALEARAKELPKPQRALVREGETRQFDYRRGVDNPLFSRLSERERKLLFTCEPSSSPPAKPDHGQRQHSGRRRKGSVSMSPALQAMSDAFVAIDDAPLDAPDFACVSIEQLDEFAKIRDSRDGACGCSCGDLVKKVAKMTARKLAAFLHERGVEATHGLGRPELLALAKAVASEEKNCQTAAGGCECARNAVPCHSDVCDGCAGACFNPLNRYEYNKHEVRAYRKQMIAAWRETEDAAAAASTGRESGLEASCPAAVQVA